MGHGTGDSRGPVTDRVKDVVEIGGAGERPRKVNLFQSPRFFADLHVLGPGQAQAPHVHGGEDKVLHVLGGEGIVTAGKREERVRPGHVVFFPAGEPHGVRNEGDEDLRLLVFMAPHPRPPAPA